MSVKSVKLQNQVSGSLYLLDAITLALGTGLKFMSMLQSCAIRLYLIKGCYKAKVPQDIIDNLTSRTYFETLVELAEKEQAMIILLKACLKSITPPRHTV